MSKPIPDTEEGRESEALFLLRRLMDSDRQKMTTYERQSVENVLSGRSVTRAMLVMIRETVERIEKEKHQDAKQ